MERSKKKKMEKWPKISVITPSYNQGQFIEETIKSVVEQNYPNLEYIIVDGGSTDNSVEIIKKYAKKYPKIIKWISEKDRGQPDALNKGFKMATGEIVGYLCSDDKYANNALFEISSFFKSNPNAKLVTGDYYIINQKGEIIHSFINLYKKFLWKFNSYYLYLFVNYINQPSTFWRKELFDEFGYFDISLQYEFDYEWWLRVLSKNKLYIINKKLSYFRLHPFSKSGKSYIKQFDEEFDIVRKKVKNRVFLFVKYLHNELIKFIYKFLRY